jgi:hypothetical protein
VIAVKIDDLTIGLLFFYFFIFFFYKFSLHQNLKLSPIDELNAAKKKRKKDSFDVGPYVTAGMVLQLRVALSHVLVRPFLAFFNQNYQRYSRSKFFFL